MQNDIKGLVVPQDIDMLTKIIEAYDHIGIVSTLDSRRGLVIIRGTEDTAAELRSILANLPFTFTIIT